MSTMDIAIEIGTTYTSVFVSGNGVVLREPTCIAYTGDSRSRRIRAVGRDALTMLGKTPEKTTIVKPVVDGIIADQDSMKTLLKVFLERIIPDSFFSPKVRAIVGIPTGLSLEERRTYELIVLSASRKIREVTLIENIILSAVGADLPFDTATGSLICNMGGGTTEIAVLSLGGVIAGCGFNVGGDMMDRAIYDSFAGKLDLKLGVPTIKKLKHEIGSLHKNDMSNMLASGTDIRTRNISNAHIVAGDIYEVIEPYYMRVADAIESIINTVPPEIGADINTGGITVVGGASQISGLTDMFADRLDLNVYVPANAEYISIIGAGKLLSNSSLLQEIISQTE